MNYYGIENTEKPLQSSSLKDLAFWSALIAANLGCIGLMVMLLFR